MSLFLAGVVVAFFFTGAMSLIFLKYTESRSKEKYEAAERKKTDLKESMETGDSSADFAASLNVLHDLANKKR